MPSGVAAAHPGHPGGPSAIGPLLDRIIRQNRGAVRFYLAFAAGIFLLGLAVVAVGLAFPGLCAQGDLGKLLPIGGGFVSTLSAFPVKEVLRHRGQAGVLEVFRLRLEALSGASDAESPELVRIRELAWKAVEKAVTG